MQVKFKLILTTAVCFLTAACTTYRPNNMVLDLEWQPDVYNMVYANVGSHTNFQYWIRRPAEYFDGYPYLQACVEVSESRGPGRFYIANIDFYEMIPVRGCEGDYTAAANLLDNPDMSGATQFASPHNGNNANNNDARLGQGAACGNLNGDGYQCFNTRNKMYIQFESLFPVYQTELTVRGRDLLRKAIKELASLNVRQITIYGVADSSGKYTLNKELAQNRALGVKRFIIENGLSAVPIIVRGSVENGLPLASERVKQRRFMMEVQLDPNYEQ